MMENQIETTIEYWGYVGIMEKKMETTNSNIVIGRAMLDMQH